MSGCHSEVDPGGEEIPMAVFDVWLPLESGHHAPTPAMSAHDAVDGSTAGIAMCHGGCLITANRGACRAQKLDPHHFP